MTDGWELFVRGASEQALFSFEEAYRRQPSVGSLNNWGSALLDLGRFGEATKMFEQARSLELETKSTSETTLVLLGVSRWCCRDESGAIRDWEASLETDYSDQGGGVKGLAFFWFGAVRTGNRAREQMALTMLRKLWTPRLLDARKWPGPTAIAGFILGEVGERQFVYEWTQDNTALEARRRCKVSFWAGVKCEDDAMAARYFQSACDDRRALVEAEYYLAKSLAGRGNATVNRPRT